MPHLLYFGTPKFCVACANCLFYNYLNEKGMKGGASAEKGVDFFEKVVDFFSKGVDFFERGAPAVEKSPFSF